MKHIESQTQQACVRWFRLQYPELAPLLFAVPNGGRRDATTGAVLKAEGVVAGVSDLILLVPSAQSHALCIELKTTTGRQSPRQKQWAQAVTEQGYRYAIVRSLEQFIQTITEDLRA